MYDHLILPLDGSADAGRAVGPASAIAHYLDLPLNVVTRYAEPGNGPRLEQLVLGQLEGTGEIRRRIDLGLITGPIADDVIANAADSENPLVVMASHGRGRSAAIVGSVASEILRRADMPVLMVGPKCEPGRFRLHGPLVVTVTASVDEEPTVAFAAELLRTFDFNGHVANVISPRIADQLVGARSAPGGGDLPADSVEAQRCARALADASGAPDVDYEVYHDDHPADALVQAAASRRAAAIVMVTHNRRGLDLFERGSVTADVVRNAPCPVFVMGGADAG